jgi:hypothetical protein
MMCHTKDPAMQNLKNQNGTVVRRASFIGTHLAAVAVLSSAIVAPCFWHRHIEAGDLPSHVYNAWLPQLVQQGRAPGLYVVWQWNNVLFDLLLFYFAKVFGFVIGPKIVVAICALVFFWGVFSFITALIGRPPWILSTCIGVLTFGYTFNMGFFNYYLSIGLACFALAFLWRPRRWDWLAGALIFALAVLAHPIGSLWLLGTIAYVTVRRKVAGALGFVIPALAIGLFVAAHEYLARFSGLEINWLDKPFFLFNGADQLVVYGSRYMFLAGASAAIAIAWFGSECLRWREHSLPTRTLVLSVELYLLSVCAIALLPQDIRMGVYSAWIGLLVSRLTIISAIFALCVLGCLKPQKWVWMALTVCAAVFFAFLYRDTAVLNRMETHAESLTATLPFGTRVIPTLGSQPDSRIPFVQHIVDRACIGRCFTYSNYEASSGQFRVRVRQGSPLVTSSAGDAQEMESGNYVVRATDPPLVNIYQCDANDFTMLCVRKLAVGDTTGPPGDPVGDQDD